MGFGAAPSRWGVPCVAAAQAADVAEQDVGGAVVPVGGVGVPAVLTRLSRGSAECPLTAAAQLELSAEMIKALRNGGAHLDFRTREGMTALHKAVRCRNHAALLVSQGSRRGGLSLPSAPYHSTGSLPPRPGCRQGWGLPGPKHLSCCSRERSPLQKRGADNASLGGRWGDRCLLPWLEHPRTLCGAGFPSAAERDRRFSCRHCWTWVPPRTTRTAGG